MRTLCSPFYRAPLALVSEITEKPVVRDGEIVARPLLTISATMDHRYLDGAHAARLRAASAPTSRTRARTSHPFPRCPWRRRPRATHGGIDGRRRPALVAVLRRRPALALLPG